MFIILPVGMNYQTRRLPIVTFTLMGMNVLVYLVSLAFTLSQGRDAHIWIYEHLWLIPALSTWHTYLTSMFVHAGFFHLLGNMLYLFLFGCCVEDIIGRWRFTALYLLSGFIAELRISQEHRSISHPRFRWGEHPGRSVRAWGLTFCFGPRWISILNILG